MTLDGFLTVLALFAAIYAVLSPVQRAQLSLSWRAQSLVAIPAFISILLFELFDIAPPSCPVVLDGYCDWLVLSASDPGLTRKFAFLIALAWLMLAVVIHVRWKPSLGSIPSFTQLAMTLIDEEQYADALKLLEPRMALLAMASRRKCTLQRLHDWLEDFGPTPQNSIAYFTRRPGSRRYCGENWPSWAARPLRALAKVIPAYARAEHAAGDMLQLLMNSPLLLTFIVERRPYFGISLICHNVYGETDFCERYLARLMNNPGSALYQELSINDVSEGLIGYRLPVRNRLLHFLFADARNAERLSVWKPVGDYLLRLLDGSERTDYPGWLHGSPNGFERDRYRDPTFMGIFFFDVMVTAAARQNVDYHMWLYYLPRLAERLEVSYDSSGDGIDRTAEFPIRAARLLYALVQTLKSWVELFERLPEDSVHRVFPERINCVGTIPHAAALALGSVLMTVVNSSRIDPGVIQTLHDTTLRQVRNLHKDSELSEMRAFLIEALLDCRHNSADEVYLNRLAVLFEEMDDVLKYEIADYEQALKLRLKKL